MLSFGIHIYEKGGGGGEGEQQLVLDPTSEEEEGFRFQTSQRMNGKT